MSMAANTIRSALRSATTVRSAAAAFRTTTTASPKPSSSPFRLLNQKPRLLRSPVELSCCVESLMPFHTATSSALLTSMISVSRNACWLPEGHDKTR